MLSLLELLHRISLANLLLEYEPPEISGGKRGLRFFRPSNFQSGNLWFIRWLGGGSCAMKLCAFATRAAKLPEGLSIFHPRSCGASSVKKVESGMPLAPMEIRPVVSNMFHVHLLFGKWSILIFDYLIFFRWVETTKQNRMKHGWNTAWSKIFQRAAKHLFRRVPTVHLLCGDFMWFQACYLSSLLRKDDSWRVQRDGSSLLLLLLLPFLF